MDNMTSLADLPRLGIGTYDFHGGPQDLRNALEGQCRMIDTSPLYGTEPVVGEAARGMRSQFFIATKVFPDSYRRKALRESVMSSLRRMDTDYIDLLQLHWPTDTVPIEETIDALSDLIDEGLVRYMGVCNFRLHEVRAAVAAAKRHPLVSNQIPYSLYDRRFESEVIPYCHTNGVLVIAYSPLAGTGPTDLLRRDRRQALSRIAANRAATVSQIALAWTIRESGTIAIPRSSQINHIRENWAAEQLSLAPTEAAELSASIVPRRQRRELEERLRLTLRRRLYSSSGQLSPSGRLVHRARDAARSLKQHLA